MKKKYIVQILSLTCLVLSVAFLTSCDDNDDKNGGQVELLSFGPSGVKHGEEIIFFGQNMDKVTSVVFFPSVEVTRDAFVSKTSEQLKVIVPDAAEAGKVILKTPAGDIETKTNFNLEVPVIISSITGEAKPGTNITITGEKLNWIEAMMFADNLVVEKDNFVSQSSTELVVTVPMVAQTGVLAFATGGTEPLIITTEDPLIVKLPAVTNVSPLSVKHTGNITISGTDLDLVTKITFSGNKVISDFVNQTESEIVVTVPVGVVNGSLTLHQASPVDVTTEEAITIILPKGTNLAPKPAIPGTDNITITGTDLDLVSELTLVGVPTPIPANQFTNHTSTQIIFALPATATNGTINYKTIHGYSNNLGVSVLIPTPGPPPLDYYIYNDGLLNGWSKWNGWDTGLQDFASTEEVFSGTTSIKVTYSGQYGAIQIGSPSAGAFSGYTTFSFRVFASAPQNFIIQIGNAADSYLSIPAGWSEVNIPVANMAGNASVTELRFKNNNASLPVTLYIDYIGLKL